MADRPAGDQPRRRARSTASRGGDDAIAGFSRDPATGTLTYLGAEQALNEPTDLALSPSGRSLYVAARGDSAIVRLARDSGSGALSFSGCLTAKREAARPAGRCALALGRGGVPQLGFGGLNSLAIAGGGLYASASRQSAISRFAIPGG